MIRLIGILIGSALAIATLIVALGLPRLSPSQTTPGIEPGIAEHTAGVDEAVLTPDSRQEDSSDVSSSNTPASALPAGAEQPAEEANPEPEGEPDQALVEQLFAAEETRAIIAPPSPEPVAEDNWYAFWSPFRSELAASGFVARLQESTGLDYRVVKVKTGVYEVAFAYTDDADIEAKLDRIAAATGLDMSGG
jgi:hypothetical protein